MKRQKPTTTTVDPAAANEAFAAAGQGDWYKAKPGPRATSFWKRYPNSAAWHRVSRQQACQEAEWHHPDKVACRRVFGYAA